MGTSGARKGYKVFSINTTIRNPRRNYEFLQTFVKFNGKLMDDVRLHSYLFELVKKGIYQFQNIDESIKNKIENDIELTPQEVENAVKNNPQATGLSGRAMTQLRSLKDQGLLLFVKGPKRKHYIYISKLGEELLNHPENAPTIYTKMLIGMHANNPSRVNMLNKSRPFLNTLFVIDLVNTKWKELGNKPKGILKHEFSTFVLSMKDCNYEKCANEIIEYRKKFKYEANESFICEYLEANSILPVAYDSILIDYPDDVFRKFEMTGLIIQHGGFGHTYYNFSNYNLAKISTILIKYHNYKFETFPNVNEYYNYQFNIVIPWETDEIIRRKIVKAKEEVLQLTVDKAKTLEEQEECLDRVFYQSKLLTAVEKIEEKTIIKELLILSGKIKAKSKFSEISEPLRLEYLLALFIGKRYGTRGLISNIIYDEEGLPLHWATSGKCDIIYHGVNGSYILEPTMQRSRTQQLNSETTNIARHVKSEEKQDHFVYRVMMIAPTIHADVVRYFKYTSSCENVKMTTVSIERSAGLFFESTNLSELNINFDKILDDLLNLDADTYTDKINSYKCDPKIIEE